MISCGSVYRGVALFTFARAFGQLLQKPIKLCEGLSFGDRRLLVHLVHLVDVLKNGCSSCVVHTVDTDVVIILIGKFFSSINYHKSFC